MTSLAIDGRAYAWCNLGPLAEDSSVAYEHSQGGGVAMLRGTITLAGVFRPAPGTVVQLAYSDGQNWIARLPLRLRVLSSFCDPLRAAKTTAISVGCDLKYFEARKEGIRNFTVQDANPDVPEIVRRAATPPIKASWVVERILSDLGLSPAGTIPLTNEFTVQEFDMTAGYVAELDKLCASESYIARVNENGLVEFIYKEPPLSTGPLVTEDDLIDLNPINTGDLPAEAVFAKYTSVSLQPPEQDILNNENKLKDRNWEREESFTPAVYVHNWTEHVVTDTGDFKLARNKDGNQIVVDSNTIGYPGSAYKITTQSFLMERIYDVKAYERQETIKYVAQSVSITNYDENDRVVSRITTQVDQWGESRTETYYTYRGGSKGGYYTEPSKDKRVFQANPSEEYGELIEERTVEYSPLAPVKMSLGLQASYQSLKSSGTYQSSERVIRYDRDKKTGITKTVTQSLVPFVNTQDGSETISRMRDRKKPWETVDDILVVATRLVPDPIETRISVQREFGAQRRPPLEQRGIDVNLKTPTVEQSVQSTFVFGSAAAQTSLELSPPYVSDDRIIRTGQNDWTLIVSDAASKALQYARIENRMLLGHRNGNGIQVLPIAIPHKPLSVFYIRLNGCTAAFLTNGTTWNIGPGGVTVTTDALFWGAVDGASISQAWFPLPSWTTQLPAPSAMTTNANPRPVNAISIPQGFNFLAPNLTSLFNSLQVNTAPIFEQTITPGSLIKPYQETIQMTAGAGAGAIIESVKPWAPQIVSLTAGAGAGAFVWPRITMNAGAIAGAIATLPPVMYAGAGAGAIVNLQQQSEPVPILDFSSADHTGVYNNFFNVNGVNRAKGWLPDANGVYEDRSRPWNSGAERLSTTNTSFPRPWISGEDLIPIYIGFKFTISSQKTIRSVGFYDYQGNGLHRAYIIELEDSNSSPVSLDSAEEVMSVSVPLGTSGTLAGKWRRVDIAGGRTLSAGTYTLKASIDTQFSPTPRSGLSGGQDFMIEFVAYNASGVSMLPGFTFEQGIYVANFDLGDAAASTQGAFFGPMLFI